MNGFNFTTLKSASSRRNLLLVVLLLVSAITASVGHSPAITQAASTTLAGWRDTGYELPVSDVLGKFYCPDPTQPGVLTIRGTDGTYAYNWVSGTQQKLNNALLKDCNRFNGLLTGEENGQAVRFTASNPQPQALQHVPSNLSSDSSLIAYSTDYAQNKLWFSSDNAVSWQERPVPGGGQMINLVSAPADARVVYLLKREEGSGDKQLKYAVYHSKDTGKTWEKGYSGEAGGIYFEPSAQLGVVPGRNVPTGYVSLNISNGGAGSSGRNSVLLSIDGGKTFRVIAVNSIEGALHSFFYSNDGLVRKFSTTYDISYDGGVSWHPLYQPYNFNSYSGSTAKVEFAEAAPANFFASDGTKLYYSPDNSRSWQVLADAVDSFSATPYTPLTLLGLKGNHLYILDLKDADKTQTRASAASNSPGGTYFEATRHNLHGIFKEYWDKNGGLAQFGYPKTEEFRELNPSDGKVYLVQYYERNRFEYHPENSGTKYEVLLGLLGNQLTAERRAKGEGAFNYFADMHYPGGTYFAETGHNLRNSFKIYWEANGGLSLYGYPTSEEFYEVNPDDGHTYVVQYFERNRFEFHPENKGTKYEVLLGLLGNTLLQQKGWL